MTKSTYNSRLRLRQWAALRDSVLAVVGLILSGCGVPPPTVPPMSLPDFQSALEHHVAAVVGRDLDGVIDTITRDERLVLIFPNGHATFTRTEYLEFHREWFGDGDWTMRFELRDHEVNGSYGYALYHTTYDHDGPGPQPESEGWLSLGFRLEDGGWRLVEDQNTRIPPHE